MTAAQKFSNSLDDFALRPWRTVAILWFAFALNYIDRQIVFVIYPALRHDLAFTETQLALAGATFLWVYSATMPLAGAAADLTSRTRMITASVILWSAATVGSGLTGSVLSFLGWRALIGVTEALYFPAAVALIRELHTDASRSRALSLHATAQLAGIVAGGWYGAWMADQFGWRTGFVLIGIIGVLYAAIVGYSLSDPRRRTQHQFRGSVRGNRLSIFRSWCYCTLTLAFLGFCATLWLFYAWFPDDLYTRHHVSITKSAVSGTAFLQGSSLIGILVGGFLGDRYSQRMPPARFYLAALGMIFSAPFAYAAFAVQSFQAAVLSCSAFGFFAGWMIANVFAAAYDVVPLQHSGFAAGVLNTVGGISGAVMIFIAGLVKSPIGFAGLVKWSVAIMSALSLLMIVCAGRRFAIEHTRAAEVNRDA